MVINSIKEAELILRKYVPNVSKLTGDGMSLDRMWPLLEALGNPHDRLKTIHVAGTSGKTSTCYYISAILQHSGKKVGLTVSPHIDSVTERLQINGIELPDDIFCKDLGEFLEIIEAVELDISYFELLIAFVIWEAERNKVEYLVLETGMGGLLDASNVITRSDKICVITDIGFDHTHILGKTLPEISYQKAGIIHENNPVFMYQQSPEVMEPVLNKVKELNSTLTTFSQEEIYKSSSLILKDRAEFQKRNWLLAEQICNFVAKRDGFTLSLPDTSKIIVPGRIERITLSDGSLLIMDGAHNQQKTSTFINSFKILYPNKKANILLALKEGKEYTDVIDELSLIADKIILTTFNTSQDLPAVSQDPKKLYEYCKRRGLEAEVIFDNVEALRKLKSCDGMKLITGSFYLISQIRHHV